MVYYATSDPEGYDLLTLLPPNITTTDNVYICGDLLDSTFVGNINSGYLNAKSNNLKNIHTILTNNRFKSVLSNRDLNKIKCLYLCKLDEKLYENTKEPFIKQFNDGKINLNISTYKLLFKPINSLNPWQIKNMNSWYPFWNPNIGNTDKYKDWSIVPDYLTTPFLDRFTEIFGGDNAKVNGGTMGAYNLLYTIPNELDLLNDNKDSPDYLAFVVLAVFNSMLTNEISNMNSIEIIKKSSPINSSAFNGWLRSLYSKSNAIEYLNEGNNLYIFSHGGVTKYLFDYYTSIEKLLIDNNKELYELLTDYNKFKNVQKGGYYRDDLPLAGTQSISKSPIEILNIINATIRENIFIVLSNGLPMDGKPTKEMLFLLLATAPFDCNSFIGKTTLDIKICQSIENTRLKSPILPGIYDLRNNMFGLKDTTIYQIIGHVPVGYAGTVDYFENSDDKTKAFIINLDTSNTLLGTVENVLNNKGEQQSKSYISIDGNIVNVHADIKLNKTKEIFLSPQYSIASNITKENKFYVSKSYNTSTSNIMINNPIDAKFIKFIKKFGKSYNKNYVNYHGYIPAISSTSAQAGGKPNTRKIKKETKTESSESLESLSDLSSISDSDNIHNKYQSLIVSVSNIPPYLKNKIMTSINFNQLDTPSEFASGAPAPSAPIAPTPPIPTVLEGIKKYNETAPISVPVPTPVVSTSVTEYHVFTHMDENSPHDKILYVLDNNDVEKFLPTQASTTSKYNSDPYYGKYLKYKQKYSSLKIHLNK